MSDRPLFQNSDAQEAAYQGQESGEEGSRGTSDDVVPGVLLPATAGAMTSGSLTGSTATGAGPTGAGAAIGAVALAEAQRDDDAQRSRD